MTVNLSPDLEEFIGNQVSSGRYESPEEVNREALRLLEERSTRDLAVDEIKKKIEVGLEQSSRGELLDGDEVFAEIDRLLEEKNPSGR